MVIFTILRIDSNIHKKYRFRYPYNRNMSHMNFFQTTDKNSFYNIFVRRRFSSLTFPFSCFPSIETRSFPLSLVIEIISIPFEHEEKSGIVERNICSLRATFELILIIESMGSLNWYRHNFHLVSLSHYILKSYQWHDEKKALGKLSSTAFCCKISFFSLSFFFLGSPLSG